MAVYEQVRHQKNIIWTSEAYFFGDGPVHILPYDPQCHELFAIYIFLCIMLGRGICEKYQSRDEKFPEPNGEGKDGLR